MTPAVAYTLYAVLALGAAALYLCFPHAETARHRLPVAGLIIGLAALAVLAALLGRWVGAGFEGRTFFVIFACLALIAAVRVVTHSKPVYSALYFIMVVLSVTGLAILASAEFLGIALVIVYAGAILVTYVFVIMLAQQTKPASYDQQAREPFAAVALAFLLAAATGQAMVSQNTSAEHAATPSGYRLVSTVARDASPSSSLPDESLDLEKKVGNVQAVGAMLMTKYVVAVEVAGVLLLVAMVGAIAIAQKRIPVDELTHEERRELAADAGDDVHRFGRTAPPF